MLLAKSLIFSQEIANKQTLGATATLQ